MQDSSYEGCMAWPAPLRELCEMHGCVAAGYGMNGWGGMWDTC